MFRTLAAFVVAPFPAALLQSAVVRLWPKVGRGVFEHPPSMFVVVCLYFYLFGLLLGLPAWLTVRRRSARLRTYVLLGLAVGLLPDVATLFVMASSRGVSAYVVGYNLMLFGLGGIAGGALFWKIGVRKRPTIDLEETFS